MTELRSDQPRAQRSMLYKVMVGVIVAFFAGATLWFVSGLLLDSQTDVDWQRGGSEESADAPDTQ